MKRRLVFIKRDQLLIVVRCGSHSVPEFNSFKHTLLSCSCSASAKTLFLTYRDSWTFASLTWHLSALGAKRYHPSSVFVFSIKSQMFVSRVFFCLAANSAHS
jgi:hypothetical protein